MQAQSGTTIWLALAGAGVSAASGWAMGGQYAAPCAGLGAMVGWFGTLLTLMRQDRPAPPPPPRSYNTVMQPVRLPVIQDDGKAGQWGRFDCERADLELLAFGLATGKPFTDAAWTGPRKPFTVRQFADVRNEMIALGWARWRSPQYPQRGAVMTAKGMAICRGMSGIIPPLPTDRMSMLARETG